MQLVAELVIANRFRLVRMLGQGGMGSVWLAQHIELDIPCAVKFIEGENADRPDFRARFQREAKAAAALRSPHVVQILDSGVWENTPYIAMELMEGEELGARLERVGKLPPGECVDIINQVGRAMMKAHAAGIVHRDLKPDNIFLTRDDDRMLVKILDFGIAKLTTSVEGSATKTGSLLGTPYYMSPEQATGNKAVDFRSDLWSLAVIVYECLTGQKPFDSSGLGELFVMIMTAPLPMPSHVNPELPASVDAWWQRAAARPVDQRFQSARELADALAMSLGVSIADRTTSMPSMPSGFGAGPATFAPVTPSPGTMPAIPAITGPGIVVPTHGGTAAPPSSGKGVLYGIIVLVVVGAVAVVFMVTRGKPTTAAAPDPPATTAAPAPPPTVVVVVTASATAPEPAEPAPTGRAPEGPRPGGGGGKKHRKQPFGPGGGGKKADMGF